MGSALRNATRTFRRHRRAWVLFGVFVLIFFLPTLFGSRILSPNDILHGYDPWGSNDAVIGRAVEVQNPTLNDIPTSYITLMWLLKNEPGSFHWNRHIASGVPGFGSAGGAVLTPLVAIPVLLLPLALAYSGIVLLKFSAAYWFGYLWLREERMGKRAASAGAFVGAAAGVVAVWWLWPLTNATALYPALFFLVARIGNGRRISFFWTAVLAASFLLSGFPATVAYGGWLALVYALVRFRAP